MTPEREREIRGDHEGLCDDECAVVELLAEVDRLRAGRREAAQALIERIGAEGPEDIERVSARAAAEIDRLRALPVIATCGACGWRRVGASYDGPVSYCGHDGMRRHLHDSGDCDFNPPSWCPLRGGR